MEIKPHKRLAGTRSARYRTIAAYVEEGIRTGQFDRSHRLPSEAELGRQFRASRTTVVRAMHELQSRGLIDRRVGSGTFVRDTSPVNQASSMPLALLGLLVAGLGNTEILDPICAAIVHQSESGGYVVLQGDLTLMNIRAARFTPSECETLVRHYIDRGVKGVFFAPLELPDDREALNFRIVDALTSAGIAVVLLDRDVTDFPKRSQFDIVGIDNFSAGYELGQHIIQTGRRQVRFVANAHYPSTTDLRMAGCRDALLRNGVSPSGSWVHIGDPADLDFVRNLLEEDRPDAIICSNDRTSAILIQSLTDLNIRVPEQIAIAGFDDVRYATLLSTPLTTMRQPCREIGLVAVQLMQDRLESKSLPPRMVLLPTTLIVRRSTDPVSAS